MENSNAVYSGIYAQLVKFSCNHVLPNRAHYKWVSAEPYSIAIYDYDEDDEDEDEDEKVCGWLAEDEGWRQV